MERSEELQVDTEAPSTPVAVGTCCPCHTSCSCSSAAPQTSYQPATQAPSSRPSEIAACLREGQCNISVCLKTPVDSLDNTVTHKSGYTNSPATCSQQSCAGHEVTYRNTSAGTDYSLCCEVQSSYSSSSCFSCWLALVVAAVASSCTRSF